MLPGPTGRNPIQKVSAVNLGDTSRCLIVERQADLAHVKQWLQDVGSDTRICVIEGITGIGKSIFLGQIERLASASGFRTAKVDGRSGLLHPQDMLQVLLEQLRPPGDARVPSGPEAFRQIAEALNSPTVLLLDHLDDAGSFLSYVRASLIPILPAQGTLLVLATRRRLPLDWSADPALLGRLESLVLGGWSVPEATEFLRRAGVGDPDERRRIWRETRGFPLAVALSAERSRQQTTTSEGTGSNAEIAHMFWHEAPRRSDDLVEALAFLRTATERTLAEVLGEEVSPRAFRSLASLSLVRRNESGFGMDRYARMYLLADLRARAPERFQTLWQRTLGVLAKRLRAKGPSDVFYRNAFDLAAMSAQASGLLVYPGMSADPGLMASKPPFWGPARSSDARHLHRLVDRGIVPSLAGEGTVQSPHELLDTVLLHFPDGVRVMRGQDGRPGAFYTLVPLGAKALGTVLKRALPDPIAGGPIPYAQSSEAETDTLLCVMSCIPPDADDFTFTEMLLSMHAAGWADLGGGKRCLLFSNLPEVSGYYRQLGYVPVPQFMGDRPSIVFSLDVRHFGMDAWLARRLAQVQDHPDGGVAVTPAVVRTALGQLHSPDALGHGELAVRFGFDGSWLQGLLIALLTAVPAPAPLDGTGQQVLRMTYLQPNQSATTIARLANMGRSTYYRHLDRAMDALTQVLSVRLATSLPRALRNEEARTLP